MRSSFKFMLVTGIVLAGSRLLTAQPPPSLSPTYTPAGGSPSLLPPNPKIMPREFQSPEDRVVECNTQKTLVDIVGTGFETGSWEYPTDLLPTEYSGLKYVSGPTDAGLMGKARWSMPVTLNHEPSESQVLVNCYRHKVPTPPPPPGTPFTPFFPRSEPDYGYRATEFHDLKAATATLKDQEAFVFLKGDLLVKVVVVGGKAEGRRELVQSTAEMIWKFQQQPRQPAATEAAPSAWGPGYRPPSTFKSPSR